MSKLKGETNSIEVRLTDDLLRAYITVIPVENKELYTK